MKSFSGKFSDDWTVLRYGWLAVFIIHITYLILGNQWLKGALAVVDPTFQAPPQLRITYALTSARMIVVGFSSVILMITVFIYEIFKMVREMKMELSEIKMSLHNGDYASHGGLVDDKSIIGDSEDEDPLGDEPELF